MKELSRITETIATHLKREKPIQAAALQHDTPLLEGWYLDSMEIVGMVLFLESTFGIAMGEGDINADNFHSIETLARLVAAKSPA